MKVNQMIALIKNDKHGLDVISEPIPEWIDPVAFAIFDCYGYSLCEEYTKCDDPKFEFSMKEITNPYRQSENDPENVMQRIATQVIE